jgi:hypothetical protein
LEIGRPIPLLPICPPTSLPIAKQTLPEDLRKIITARAAAIVPWADMSPAETREHPATAGNPASREIRNPAVDAAMVAVAVTPVVEVAAEPAEGIAAAGTAVGIEAAGKRVDEEFQ